MKSKLTGPFAVHVLGVSAHSGVCGNLQNFISGTHEGRYDKNHGCFEAPQEYVREANEFLVIVLELT